VLTQRSEPFWRDNLDPTSIPDRLKNLLHLWKYQSPWFFDEFDRLEEVFPAASYQYVLYGMGFRTEVQAGDNTDSEATASQLMRENAAMTQKLRSQLPKNRELLRKIYEHGLQRI
jgi:tryptophan halogenase